MDYKQLFKSENEEVRERYELVINGIKSNIENDTCKKAGVTECFVKVANLVSKIDNIYRLVECGEIKNKSIVIICLYTYNYNT